MPRVAGRDPLANDVTTSLQFSRLCEAKMSVNSLISCNGNKCDILQSTICEGSHASHIVNLISRLISLDISHQN